MKDIEAGWYTPPEVLRIMELSKKWKVSAFIHDSFILESSPEIMQRMQRLVFERPEALQCMARGCLNMEPMRPAVVSTIDHPHGPTENKGKPRRTLPRGWGYVQRGWHTMVYCPRCWLVVQGLAPGETPIIQGVIL
jgi:hypothetical protein